ncbi:helix-turn-helix domain-containing protein [Flavobacterium cerinum]|uniref:Helix-turn-helix domain-containing protein n=1 Tax=Flavobacterium cerinum TaxID=2502784 RepID=A0ABY5IR52_9FLAO|nr:helix-turn-helix domain-containing protein [Flavobacterium cerinum]UUC43864.1 helix-turn-helix domain-containing protein [Flavobacterium cerinum]
MLFLLLILVSATNALTLYVILRNNSDTPFDKVIRYAVLVSLVHSVYALCARYYFADSPFIDSGVPFGLLYGPILYFLAFSNDEKRPSRKNILLHLGPFLLVTIVYIVFLVKAEVLQNFSLPYFIILYSGKVLSMVLYVSYLFLNQKKMIADGRLRKLINSGATWLLLIASLFASLIFSKVFQKEEMGALFPGVILYGVMLFVSLLIFKYCIDSLLQYSKTEEALSDDDLQMTKKQYQKSALTPEILREYEQKLNEMMEKEQIFLDTELSLESLSRKVKIPKHHLTQLFNMTINQTFYQYINSYRVSYSCQLLLDEPETNLEEIAFKSGFNSKVTFNRYFKNLMECTPSEYRQS